MPSAELDLPVLVAPEQIRRREFVQTRRGYDPTQVRDYLEQIARQVEQMQGLLREARLEADAAAKASASPRADPYQQLASRVADVLRAADRHAERTTAEARAEAETVLREARADADRIRLDAQSTAEDAREQAERALREARERADDTISGLASRRAALVDQLASMQERLLSVARELDDAIDGPGGTFDLVTSARELGEEPPPSSGEPAIAPWPAAPSTDAADPAEDPPDHPRDDPGTGVIDLAARELWAGDEVELQIPEIPPLDLDWDATDE